MLKKPSVPAVNALAGARNEEQGLVQVGPRLLTAAGAAAAAAQLSTGLTGSMQNMSPCNQAHKSGQKVLRLTTFGLRCCGAAEGRETDRERCVVSANPSALTEAWSTARQAAKNAGAKKIMKNSENEHNSL